MDISIWSRDKTAIFIMGASSGGTTNESSPNTECRKDNGGSLLLYNWTVAIILLSDRRTVLTSSTFFQRILILPERLVLPKIGIRHQLQHDNASVHPVAATLDFLTQSPPNYYPIPPTIQTSLHPTCSPF